MPSLNRESIIVPVRTSKAADEDSPLPLITSEETKALNPESGVPISEKAEAIPLIRPADVPFSVSTGERESSGILIGSYPSELTRIKFSLLAETIAIASALTAAASTHPC